MPLLPVRERPLPGESLHSLLRRTAFAMGYDNTHWITRLLGETCRLHQDNNRMPPGPHLDQLAQLMGLSSPDLLALTVHSFAHVLVLQPAGSAPSSVCDNKTALRFFAAQTSSICAQCLATDSPPYERLLWNFRPLQFCLRHASPLLFRCPACQRPFPRSRKDILHCRCGNLLTECAVEKESSSALACVEALESWLHSRHRDSLGLPSTARFWFAERLADAIGKTPSWLQQVGNRFKIDPTKCPELLKWTAAADLFASWPERLFEFLDSFQRVSKNRTLSTGVSCSFGLLLRDVSFLERLGYAIPADALRRYLAERYTGGHVTPKVGLFRERENHHMLSSRPWCTQVEAARLLQMRCRTVADLVRRGILEGRIQAAGKRGRSIGLVSKTSAEALRVTLESGLSIDQARRRLGISKSLLLALVHTETLKGAVRTRKGWIVPKEAIQGIDAFCRELALLGTDRQGWLPLRQALRVFGPSGLNLPHALQLAQAGKVAARQDGGRAGLRGVWLSETDLAAQVPALLDLQGEKRGYALSRVARILLSDRSCGEPVVKKWIQAGFLRPERRGRRWVVSPNEVTRFRGEYCLAEEACSILQISRTTLSSWEKSGRVTPVYGRRSFPGAGFSLYRRSDLQHLSRRHRRHA